MEKFLKKFHIIKYLKIIKIKNCREIFLNKKKLSFKYNNFNLSFKLIPDNFFLTKSSIVIQNNNFKIKIENQSFYHLYKITIIPKLNLFVLNDNEFILDLFLLLMDKKFCNEKNNILYINIEDFNNYEIIISHNIKFNIELEYKDELNVEKKINYIECKNLIFSPYIQFDSIKIHKLIYLNEIMILFDSSNIKKKENISIIQIGYSLEKRYLNDFSSHKEKILYFKSLFPNLKIIIYLGFNSLLKNLLNSNIDIFYHENILKQKIYIYNSEYKKYFYLDFDNICNNEKFIKKAN